jgi:hypothetical protein
MFAPCMPAVYHHRFEKFLAAFFLTTVVGLLVVLNNLILTTMQTTWRLVHGVFLLSLVVSFGKQPCLVTERVALCVLCRPGLVMMLILGQCHSTSIRISVNSTTTPLPASSTIHYLHARSPPAAADSHLTTTGAVGGLAARVAAGHKELIQVTLQHSPSSVLATPKDAVRLSLTVNRLRELQPGACGHEHALSLRISGDHSC